MIEAQTNPRASRPQLAKAYIFVIQFTATYYGYIADLCNSVIAGEQNNGHVLHVGKYTVAGSLAGALTTAGLWKLNSYYNHRQNEYNPANVVAPLRGDSSYRRAALIFVILNRTINLALQKFTNFDELESGSVSSTDIIIGLALALLSSAIAVMASSYIVKKQNTRDDTVGRSQAFTT